MPMGRSFMMWLAAQTACMVASATMSDSRDCADRADTCNSLSGRHSLVSEVELHDEVSLLQMQVSSDDAQQELEDPKVKMAEDAKVEEFKKKEDDNAESKQVEKDAKKVDQIKTTVQQKETVQAMENTKNEEQTKNEANFKESIAKGKDKTKQKKADKAEEKRQIKEDRDDLKKKHKLDKKQEDKALKQQPAVLKIKEEQLHNAHVKAEQDLKDKHRFQEHDLAGQHAEEDVADVRHKASNIGSNEVPASRFDSNEYERVLDAEVTEKRAQIRARMKRAIGGRMDMAGEEAGWQGAADEKTR